MSPKLRAMVVSVGLFLVGGVTYSVYRREPPGRKIEDLRDAGLLADRTGRFVLACPEKITAATARYLERNGYGTFAAGSIHRIARVVIQHTDAADGGLNLINPSLDVMAVEDGGDEDDQTDDSLQYRTDDCYQIACNAIPDELRLLADAGFRHRRVDETEAPWCNSAVRRGRLTPPCVLPNCWTLSDGGWDDNAVVDCQGTGPFGNQPGGTPRWRGCNVTPSQFAVGTACLPVECSVVAGDDPIQVLR